MNTINTQPTYNHSFELSKELIKVKLSIGQYSGRVKSKRLSQETAVQHEADEASIDSILKLLKDDDSKPIKKIGNKARTLFYDMTLPFEDDKWYIIPNAMFGKLQTELTQHEVEFKDAVNDLVARYDKLLEDYKQRMGKLVDYAHFPSAVELKSKFYFKLETDVIADPSTVSLKNISAQLDHKIRSEVEARLKHQVSEAQADVAKRIVTMMTRIVDTLSDTTKDQGTFRDSLIGNVRDAVDILPSLNVLNDSRITAAIKKIQDEITPVHPQVLRDDNQVKAKVKQSAKSVLDDLKDFKPITI